MTQDFDFLNAPKVFVRIYEMPEKLTNGFCFGGGVPITFKNVDWFEVMEKSSAEGLIEYIEGKPYAKNNARLLVLGDHPDFVFTLPRNLKSQPSDIVAMKRSEVEEIVSTFDKIQEQADRQWPAEDGRILFAKLAAIQKLVPSARAKLKAVL